MIEIPAGVKSALTADSASTGIDCKAKIHPDYIAHARGSFLSELQLEPFLQACGNPLRASVRINRLKIDRADFIAMAVRYHWKLQPIPWCADGFWVEVKADQPSLGNMAEHVQGLFYIQEASSMLPPQVLLSELTQDSTRSIDQLLVADMAAAPGSKTTQLASILQNRGLILANELSASRLKSLHSNLVRCGVLNTCLSHLDARQIGQWMPAQFDFVLLDAPCGGEGTVRKDAQALVNWNIKAVLEIAGLQQELILSAYQALKPGGRLVYSTCTLSFDENHHVANYLVAQTDAQIVGLGELFEGAEKALSIEGYLHVLPQLFDSEGFFVACFTKPEDSPVTKLPIEKYDSPFEPINPKLEKQLIEYYQQHFDFNPVPPGYQLLQRAKEIWLFPLYIQKINRYLKVNRAGFQIAQIFPNKIRSSHEMATCLGYAAKRQKIDLSVELASQFMQGLNLSISDKSISDGEVLLEYRGQILGVGQNQKGKIKNGLPRDLVRDNLNFIE